MSYQVVYYEHPNIIVRHDGTGETFPFIFGEDGTLIHDSLRFDLGDAKRVAIAHRFKIDRQAETRVVQ